MGTPGRGKFVLKLFSGPAPRCLGETGRSVRPSFHRSFPFFGFHGAYAASHTIPRSSAHTLARGLEFFPLFGSPFLLIALFMILVPLWASLAPVFTASPTSETWPSRSCACARDRLKA